MKTLYTDASFDWNSTDKASDGVVRGKIAISGFDNFNYIENVVIGKVEGLKQYINVFELVAIARAVELASQESPKAEALTIFSDSKVATSWARKGIKNRNNILTEAHSNALEYLRRARILFGGEVTFNFIGREDNPAGHLLEAESKK